MAIIKRKQCFWAAAVPDPKEEIYWAEYTRYNTRAFLCTRSFVVQFQTPHCQLWLSETAYQIYLFNILILIYLSTETLHSDPAVSRRKMMTILSAGFCLAGENGRRFCSESNF